MGCECADEHYAFMTLKQGNHHICAHKRTTATESCCGLRAHSCSCSTSATFSDWWMSAASHRRRQIQLNIKEVRLQSTIFFSLIEQILSSPFEYVCATRATAIPNWIVIPLNRTVLNQPLKNVPLLNRIVPLALRCVSTHLLLEWGTPPNIYTSRMDNLKAWGHTFFHTKDHVFPNHMYNQKWHFGFWTKSVRMCKIHALNKTCFIHIDYKRSSLQQQRVWTIAQKLTTYCTVIFIFNVFFWCKAGIKKF